MLQVNLTPEDVNAYVAKAIVESSIGTLMTQRINAALADYKLSSAIDQAILAKINEMMRDQIEADEVFKARLAEKVKAALTDSAVQVAVDKLVLRISRDW